LLMLAWFSKASAKVMDNFETSKYF
jgi:hypothetical protein